MTTTVANELETLRSRFRIALAERLPRHPERLGWPAAQLEAHQREHVRVLLEHAVERSPFHRDRLGGIDVDRFELDDLPSSRHDQSD